MGGMGEAGSGAKSDGAKPDDDGVLRICFVCLGNICRSPTAEAVMRHLVGAAGLEERIQVDSAGTGGWHVGEPPDRRSREVGERRGMPLSGRARQFVAADFKRFDLVLAMDGQNFDTLVEMAPDDAAAAKIHRLRVFDAAAPPDADVPDPYYGGADGFDRVFDICEAACRGLLTRLRADHRI